MATAGIAEPVLLGEPERGQTTRDETGVGIEKPHPEQRHRDPRDHVGAEDRAADERGDLPGMVERQRKRETERHRSGHGDRAVGERVAERARELALSKRMR